MDTPQRWQVGSVATAIAGLSLGGLLLGRPSTEPVAPIELVILDSPDVPDVPDVRQDEPTDTSAPEPTESDQVPPGPEIVEPEQRDAGPDPVDPDSPETPPSVDSPSSADSD